MYTYTSTKSISAILSHLFEIYIYLTSDSVKEAEEKVHVYLLNIADPPIVLYKALEGLKEILRAAGLLKVVFHNDPHNDNNIYINNTEELKE